MGGVFSKKSKTPPLPAVSQQDQAILVRFSMMNLSAFIEVTKKTCLEQLVLKKTRQNRECAGWKIKKKIGCNLNFFKLLKLQQLKTQRDKMKQFIKRKEKCMERERQLAKQLIADGRKE